MDVVRAKSMPKLSTRLKKEVRRISSTQKGWRQAFASICRSRRRSAARHAELNLAEIARRDEPIVNRPPPPKPPAPRRRVPPEESADVPEGGATPLEVIQDNPPEALGSNEDPRPWARRVRRRAERLLRSVSRSASPSDKPGQLCLRSRSPTPELSPRSDLARAVRGESAPSRPGVPIYLGSPTEGPSSEDEMARAVRGEAAPSRPNAPAAPDFGHLEVDRYSPLNVDQPSDAEPGLPERGESSPSKMGQAESTPKPVPAALQRLLEGYPQMGDGYAPYKAVLGYQRRNPKLIWHYFVAVRQELPRVRATHIALQQRGQQFERKVFQLVGYGANRGAFARADGNEVLKIGMPGSHGLEVLLTPRVMPLAAQIYDAGQIQMEVAGREVPMDLIVQQKLVLLRDVIKNKGPLPEEYWSYIIAVVAAVAARGLNLADLGQSNLAAEEMAFARQPAVEFHVRSPRTSQSGHSQVNASQSGHSQVNCNRLQIGS